LNAVTNHWRIKSIGEIVSISKGRKIDRVYDHDIPNGKRYIQIDDLRNNHNLKYSEDPGVEVNSRDVIIAWDGANAGTIGFGLQGYIGSTLARLRICDSEVDSFYLGWFLRNKSESIRKKCYGATIPHVSKSVLESIEIPLPPLPIQKQISAILEKTDTTREKRRKTNQLTEQFLQSTFLEMFGDPITNPKKWKIEKLGEVGTLQRGRSKHRPRNARFLLGGPYPLIQTGEIANSMGYITNYTQTYSELGLKQSKMWKKGTLCITIAANIGKTAILTFDACFPDSIVGFKPNGRVKTEFIQRWFTFVQKKLEDSAPMVAQKNISLEILRKLDVPVPPLDLQQNFVTLVEKVESLRAKQWESEKELENLFQSLMQRAFKGELVG